MLTKAATSISLLIFACLTFTTGCSSIIRREDVRPRVLRDVPAQNMAYRLQADVTPPTLPDEDDPNNKLAAIQAVFSTKERESDALVRTVVSPDGRRVLVLYGTESESSSAFRIDLYNSEGQFLRNLIPPDLSCVFPETVAWSPDGNAINFIARRRAVPSPSPTPLTDFFPDPSISPVPSPSIAPVFPAVVSFNTEQIYICNREGYDLKPLTSREGLIYFYFAWAPDTHAMVALACKEDEWDAREKQFRSPAGRPRLITLDGQERLLDDGLTDALPVWSPDASKVATAFEADVAIYDAATDRPTQARLPLQGQLIAASVVYEEKVGTRKSGPANTGNAASASPSPQHTPAPVGAPPSFNPIVRLEWPTPELLYFQTAYVRLIPNETINTFQRWHLLNLSAQAAILK